MPASLEWNVAVLLSCSRRRAAMHAAELHRRYHKPKP
jgi:hypothetical protein